ncbi:hypothetical protein ACNKF0_09515 [Nocardioides sp. T5]|uniref:hypothetical protein n=1 Tax=Nocardioides sp. T5 TaxID=3400182 RepID=UPI003A852EA2
MTSKHASTTAQRELWRRRAVWLSQLGLAPGEAAPVEVLEEVADAVLLLLAEVQRLELERAEARAWAWGDYHRELDYGWVSVAGNRYTGEPDELPGWLADPRTPDQQEWWPHQR